MRSSWNPYDELGRLYPGLHYERVDLAPTRGALVLSQGVVLIDERLSKAEARSTMAHELGHLDAGDLGCSGLIHDRREAAADEWAARRLMSACDLAEVMRWTSSRTEAAELMDVTTHLLAVRLQHLHPAERGYLLRAAQTREDVA